MSIFKKKKQDVARRSAGRRGDLVVRGVYDVHQKACWRFYFEVWNSQAESVAHEILAPDFRFRGSLGPEKIGVDGFLDYTRDVHRVLGRYECIIEDMVESGDRLAARMLFRGIHQAEFFGVPASGREIAWGGAAFFTAKDARLASLWVLGDVDAVKAQLQD